MTKRHVAFLDLDGTILDSAPGIVAGLQEAYKAVGIPAPDEATLRTWIGPPIRQTLARELSPHGRDAVEVANSGFRSYFDAVGVRQSTVFAGMAQALDDLTRSGTMIVVVTHKPRDLAAASLSQHALAHLITGLYAPHSPTMLEPKDKLFARAIADARPSSALAAGDRGSDVEAAAAHGINSVGVTWGFGTAAELSGAGAIALAAHPCELPALLTGDAGRG